MKCCGDLKKIITEIFSYIQIIKPPSGDLPPVATTKERSNKMDQNKLSLSLLITRNTDANKRQIILNEQNNQIPMTLGSMLHMKNGLKYPVPTNISTSEGTENSIFGRKSPPPAR